MSDKIAREVAFQAALSMYADEPCRICGRPLTMDDLRDGAVFAGYNADNTSRAAHKQCWDNAMDVMRKITPVEVQDAVREWLWANRIDRDRKFYDAVQRWSDLVEGEE